MKKSVILLIGIIYILAIVVVSFFGLKVETFNETKYVTSIECINEGVQLDSQGEKYVVIAYEDQLVYQIEWRVFPDEASNNRVAFVYDENKTTATVNDLGRVYFNRKGAIKVFIMSTDGSNISDTITIIAR